MPTTTLILLGVIFFLVIFLFYLIPVNLWITAQFSGVRINLFDLMFMRFRKVPPKLIVRSLILVTKAGIKEVNSQKLEMHYLANGNLEKVIKALIMADKANLNLGFKQATALLMTFFIHCF